MATTRLHRAAGVMVQELDEQLMLIRVGSPDVLHLDAVASDVWRLLEQPASRPELVRAVAQAYAVDEARVEADLQPLLELLLAQGLVVERVEP